MSTEKNQQTMMFRVKAEEDIKVKDTLKHVYGALQEKGYNPIDQLVGYLLSGDPAYITSHKNSRQMIRKLERDEILEEMLSTYLSE